jgi:hypothetical protein
MYKKRFYGQANDSGLFASVVAVAFHTKIYQNNIFFYFLKIIFKTSTSKLSKT